MAGRTPIGVVSVNRFALTTITVSQPADVANGNVTPNDGATWFAVFNADASPTHLLTVTVVNGVDGLPAGPRPYTIPGSASGTQLFGPFPIQFYGSQLLWNGDSSQIKVQPYSVLGP
jgi:hypothetical protein